VYSRDRVFGVWNAVFQLLKSASEQYIYKPCTSAVSESEFDHANRILRLRSRRASIYSAKIIKMPKVAIDCLLIAWWLHGSLSFRETDSTTFPSVDTQDAERGQLQRILWVLKCYLNLMAGIISSLRQADLKTEISRVTVYLECGIRALP